MLNKASGSLTSVALELGGETGSWRIARKDADIKGLQSVAEGDPERPVDGREDGKRAADRTK